ncbi:Serine proteinase stubble, partial [Stegodyphus mimosarum]
MNYQKSLAACTLIYYIFIVILTFGKNASTIKIRPESCTNAMGEKGTCMFVWQCIKQDGIQLGPCVDRFLVGTCCSLPKEEDNLVPGSSGSSSNSSSTLPPFSPTKGDSFTKVKPAASSVQMTVTKPPMVMTSAPLTVGTGSITVGTVPSTLVQPIASSLIAQDTTAHSSLTTKP